MHQLLPWQHSPPSSEGEGEVFWMLPLVETDTGGPGNKSIRGISCPRRQQLAWGSAQLCLEHISTNLCTPESSQPTEEVPPQSQGLKSPLHVGSAGTAAF